MIQIVRVTNCIEALLALPFIENIDKYYPKVADWYVNTVAPGLIESTTVLLLAKKHNTVVGMALGKNGEEKKLRCVRVQQDNTGLGIRLIDNMLEHLQATKPFCTVSEELLHDYSRFFINRYGFSLDLVTKGEYRPAKLEYHFNKA